MKEVIQEILLVWKKSGTNLKICLGSFRKNAIFEIVLKGDLGFIGNEFPLYFALSISLKSKKQGLCLYRFGYYVSQINPF